MLFQRTAVNFHIQDMNPLLLQIMKQGNQSVFNRIRFKSARPLPGFDMDKILSPSLSVSSAAVPQKAIFP